MFNPVENFFPDCTMGRFLGVLVQYWYSMDCTSPLTGVKVPKIRLWYSILVILVQCVTMALVQLLQNKRTLSVNSAFCLVVFGNRRGYMIPVCI